VAQLHYNTSYPIPVGSLQPWFTVFHFIPQSILHLLIHLCWDRHSFIRSVWIVAPLVHSTLYTPMSLLVGLGLDLIDSHQCSTVWIVAAVLRSTLLFPRPVWVLVCWCSTARSASVLLCLNLCSPISFHTIYPPIALLLMYEHSSIHIGAVQPWFVALLFHSTLLKHLLIPPLFRTAYPIRHSSFPSSFSPFASKYIILPFKPQIWFAAS